MSVCNFTIPFSGTAEELMEKTKDAIEKQGGNFSGNTRSGNFDVTVIGNSIAGSYTVDGNNLSFVIDKKPFFIPCETVESFLKSKLA